jgi:membrane protein implicated in regulation of membrane protease activity
MNQIKVYTYLERFWMIISIISLAWAIYIAVADSVQISKVYFLLSAIAISLYLTRRFLRKRLERAIKEQQSKK